MSVSSFTQYELSMCSLVKKKKKKKINSDSNQEPPEKTPWRDNDSISDERFESENECADAQDPPVTAGCTAAQIRDNARQIIRMCCPRTDWRLSCGRWVMSKLILNQPVLGELYAFGNEKSSTSVNVSANTRACGSSTRHKRSWYYLYSITFLGKHVYCEVWSVKQGQSHLELWMLKSRRKVWSNTTYL